MCLCIICICGDNLCIIQQFGPWAWALGTTLPPKAVPFCLFEWNSEIFAVVFVFTNTFYLALNFWICSSLSFVNLDSWDWEQLSENGNTEEKRWWEEDLWDSWEILCFGIQNFVEEDCPRKRKVRRIMLVPSLISSWWWWWW